MADIGFYHVTRQSPLQALARLMEKAYGQGLRVLIRVPSEERAREVDTYLWTYNPGSFLPHGISGSDDNALQPVLIATDDVPHNQASILTLLDGVMPDDFSGFERVLYVFDGQDPAQTERARQHWRQLKAANHSLAYWEQQEGGGWNRAA